MKFSAVVLVACVLVSVLVVAFPVVRGADYTLSDLDSQISKGLDWLDRFIYYEYNSTNAISSASPFVAFSIRHSNGVNWTISDKMTNTNYQDGAVPVLKGGCIGGTSADLGKLSSSYPKICMTWNWDIDGDKDYSEDGIFYTEYSSLNDTFVQLFINVTKWSVGSGYALFLGVNTTAYTSSLAFNQTWTISQNWGFVSPYSFMRPTVKGLADLYYKLNVTVNPATGHTYAYDRGINYAGRSYKLMKTFYESGYLLDRFDGMYNVTLKERPFSDLHGGIGATPDMIYENRWWFDVNDNSQGYKEYVKGYDYYTNGYWKNYADCNMTSTGTKLWRQAMCSRTIMPDEKWWGSPFAVGNNTNPVWMYRSRTGLPVARNCYVSNGFYADLAKQGIEGLPLTDVLMGTGSDVKMLRACSDLYKYGLNHPWGLSFVKDLINSVYWDGYGVPMDKVGGFLSSLIGYAYPVYATHVTTPYLNALVQYGKVTGDPWSLNRADEVAGVLVRTQIKEGVSFWNKAKSAEYYFSDAVGAFLSGYTVAYSMGFGDILWDPLSKIAFWWYKVVYDGFNGDMGFQYDNFPHTTFGSPESSLPAVWSLIEYRQLGRLPNVYTDPDVRVPLEDSVCITDYGGDYGEVHLKNTALSGTSLGGNRMQYVGDCHMFRIGVDSLIFGGSWATIEWKWNVTLNQTVTGFHTKECLTFPECSSVNNNNATVFVEWKFRDNSTVLASSIKNIILNEAGTDWHMIVGLNDTTQISTLYAGNYTYTVKLRIESPNGGEMFLGYNSHYDVNLRMWIYDDAMYCGLESAGYEWDVANVSSVQRMGVSKNGLGTVYAKHIVPDTARDGCVWGENATYATTFDRANSYDYSTGFVDVGQYNSWGLYDRCRGFFEFNTTMISADVTSARLKVYCKENLNTSGVAWYINVTDWTGDDPINSGDYNQYGAVTWGSTLGSAVANASWITINLNVSAIVKSNYTRLCLLSSRDLSNSTPVAREYLHLWDYSDGGSGVAHLELIYDPMYVATYDDTVWLVAYPDSGYYFLGWTANNSVINLNAPNHPVHGRFYGWDAGGYEMNATYDFNVTAWFGSCNYTKGYEGKESFTCWCDLNFDDHCDIKDISYATQLFGKDSDDADWYSSGAYFVDALVWKDNKIDIHETSACAQHFGDDIDNLAW